MKKAIAKPVSVKRASEAPKHRLRPAALKDALALATLAEELGYASRPAVLRKRLMNILERADHLVAVAEKGKEISGWIHAHSFVALESGFRVEILGLIVGKNARRLGLGGLLVAEAEAWAARIRAEAVTVRSNLKRVESHAFYPALGFTKVKMQAVYRKSV